MNYDKAGFERALIIALLMFLCSDNAKSEGMQTAFFIGFFLWVVAALMRRFLSSDS